MRTVTLKNVSTQGIVGTAWTKANRELIKQAIDQAMRGDDTEVIRLPGS